MIPLRETDMTELDRGLGSELTTAPIEDSELVIPENYVPLNPLESFDIDYGMDLDQLLSDAQNGFRPEGDLEV